MKYDYHGAMYAAIKEWLAENCDGDPREADYYELYDNMWVDNYVTHCDTIAFPDDKQYAAEYLDGNFDLMKEAADEFGYSYAEFGKRMWNEEWQWFDSLIRCHLLGGVLDEVLANWKEE